jgi:hypothetical protein
MMLLMRMEHVFTAASAVSTVLKFAGVAFGFAGVMIFGFHFIRENARSARQGESHVRREAWRGEGPKKGIRLFAIGVAVVAASLMVSLILPGAPG